MTATLHLGDCRAVLADMEPESIDAVVCDPPYELAFMNKGWDAAGVSFDAETWRACLRVLKPGGHLLAFGGTRTVHRIAVAIEDAGFEIRDQIVWMYGSGFPKSLDVSKAMDKRRDDLDDISVVVRFLERARQRSGVSRKQVEDHFGTVNIGQALFTLTPGTAPRVPTMPQWTALKALLGFGNEMDAEVKRLNGRKGTPGEAWHERPITGTVQEWVNRTNYAIRTADGLRRDIPATDLSRRYDGYGTALKPAHEPVVVARKPLRGTVAANVTEYGTGALNIDGCRIGDTVETWPKSRSYAPGQMQPGHIGATQVTGAAPSGRWPANVCLDEGAAALLDAQSGASRFYYVAKASRSERNAGLDGMPRWSAGDQNPGSFQSDGTNRNAANHHPTVKPIALMRWLVRLVTPPHGVVCDPFLGSGTTGCAAALEGFGFIGIEQDAEYLEIARRRIAHWSRIAAAERPAQLALSVAD